MKCVFLLIVCLISSLNVFSQWIPTNELPDTLQRNIRSKEYLLMQQKLCSGWNTWYSNSVLTHVLLPEAFSIGLCFAEHNNRNFLQDAYKASDFLKRPEKVDLGFRTVNGSYTELILEWKGVNVKIQTAHEGNDQIILVTPLTPSKDYLIIEPGILWGHDGSIGKEGERLYGKFHNKKIVINSKGDKASGSYLASTSPRIVYRLTSPIIIYTGIERTLSDIKGIIDRERTIMYDSAISKYGTLSEAFLAMQSILSWNTIYDAPNQRAISPVSRLWNEQQGGWTLYEWDTNFASMMFSLFSKELAYSNAVEIVKGITSDGFIPGRISVGWGRTNDRSQPPVGSMAVWHIYEQYKEKWFLEECYNELLSWNRWWVKARSNDGYLCWGYDGADTSKVGWYENARWLAICESGLDNTHMYDDVPFNVDNHTLDIADVGLISMYIMDCKYLSKIALALERKNDSKELIKRAKYYTKVLQKLWSHEHGIYLNKRLDTGKFSLRISPTNFYPMLAGACTQAQAERMIKEHYFNASEFYGEYVIPSTPKNDPAYKDNSYWRGRIWGPMNFLVYWGMRNYNIPKAYNDLKEKSYNLFIKQWKKSRSIYENYNSVTGEGSDVGNADGYLNWGALLVYMTLNDL